MRDMLTAFALCALFILALTTVRLKTRARLLGYEIAELEAYEGLLLERIEYYGWKAASEGGMVDLLDKSVRYDISLSLESPGGRSVPLLTPVEEGEALE